MAAELIDTAQAILTATDTALSKAYREEDRAWRKDDLGWRQVERAFMQQQQAWRQEDLEQRQLENARALWARAVEKNRRDVEERAEQLKAISSLSALIAGFVLTAFLQFDFAPSASTEGVQMAFGVTIAITVALEANAMMLCSLIHASILKIGRTYVSSQEEADFMARARHWAANYRPGDRPPAPRRNFQAHWAYACEGQWRIAFLCFSLGIPVFFLNMALAAWIKFDYSKKTAISMTVIMGLAFAFYLVAQNRWSWHMVWAGRRELMEEVLPQAPACGMPWDWHRRPNGGPSTMHQRLGSLGGLEKHSSDTAAAPGQSDSELGA